MDAAALHLDQRDEHDPVNDENSWLRLDLERIVLISEMVLRSAEGNRRRPVDVSGDGGNGWNPLVDQAGTRSLESRCRTV